MSRRKKTKAIIFSKKEIFGLREAFPDLIPDLKDDLEGKDI